MATNDNGNRAIVELTGNSPNWANVVDDILKIERRLFPEHESLTRSFHQELKKSNVGLLYLQLMNGEVAGYVIFAWPSSSAAFIIELAVKECHQRQGHGEALLQAAIEKCRTRNVQRVSLHVDVLRTPAMNLYKKLGFQVDVLLPGYYSTDRDAYRMFLEFDLG